VTVNIPRVITLGLDPSIKLPNGQIYSRYGAIFTITFALGNVQAGDVLHAVAWKGDNPYTFTQPMTSIQEVFLLEANFNIPVPIKMWITGSDGVQSNVLWLLYRGSQQMAVQNSATGEIYYYYSGDDNPTSSALLKFKPDGTADGSVSVNGNAIAVDNQTGYVLTTVPLNILPYGGLFVYDLNGGRAAITMGSSTTLSLAIDAQNGLACATQPDVDTAYCFLTANAMSSSSPPTVFPLPMPTGSQPTAVKVLDGSHVVVYGSGDQTLRWFTISGTTATASGTLKLGELTATDSTYWSNYPDTGGWSIVQVGSTLGVMGQVVNTDGTVDQELAIVNNASQAQVGGYVKLPAGTILIAPDAANGAITAEYPDTDGAAPVMRFARFYLGTGNFPDLTSTSTLVPAVGFLCTQNGKLATFVLGQADFEPNQ